MHAGKHQEYEKKLHDALLNKTQTPPNPPAENQKPPKNKENANNRETSVSKDRESLITKERENSVTPPNRDSWPLLNKEIESKDKDSKKPDVNSKKSTTKSSKSKNGGANLHASSAASVSYNPDKIKTQNRNGTEGNCLSVSATNQSKDKEKTQTVQNENNKDKSKEEITKDRGSETQQIQNENNIKIHSFLDDNSSFFSQNTFQKIFSDNLETENNINTNTHNGLGGDFSIHSNSVLNEPILDIHNTEDWEAAFGFTKHSNHLEELAKMRNNMNGLYEKNNEIAQSLNSQLSQNLNTNEIAHSQGLSNEISQSVLDVFAAQKNGVTNGFQKFFDEEKANCFLKYQPGWLQNYELQQQRRQLEEQLAQLNMKSGYFGGGNRLGWVEKHFFLFLWKFFVFIFLSFVVFFCFFVCN